MEKKLSSPMLSSSVRNKIMRGGLIGQRRQLSDPKIYPMYSSISKDGDLESKYERVSHPLHEKFAHFTLVTSYNDKPCKLKKSIKEKLKQKYKIIGSH
jgi:hypothetical protein